MSRYLARVTIIPLFHRGWGFSKQKNPERFKARGRLQRSQVVGTDFILTGPLGVCRGKGFAQLLMPDEPECRAEVAGQKKDHLVAVLWRTNPSDPTSLQRRFLHARCGARYG